MSYGEIYKSTWWGNPQKDGWGDVYYDLANQYLLDTYTGAAAAYSLRTLSSDTTNVVRVRRDSDNAEQDFNATEVIDGTLETFVGVGNGYVTTWYDQSGNGNDATQAIAASQPMIVDAGVLVEENGKPAVSFDGVDDFMYSLSSISGNSIFLVQKYMSGLDFSSNGAQPYIQTATVGVYRTNIYSPFTSTLTSGDYALQSFIASGSSDPRNVSFYENSLGAIENPISLNLAVFTLLKIASYTGIFYEKKYQEIIIYDSDQSINRTSIETNINDYYNIY